MKQKHQLLFEKHKHLLLLLYFPAYCLWFAYLEKTVTTHFHVIHMDIDDFIPFCEYFIVPYLLWFLYVAVTVLYTSLTDKKQFLKMCTFLYTGMTLFLVISTLYPNGHFLRPLAFERDNIFTELCSWLYQTDTSTNLFPSIHVYNSIGAHLAVIHHRKLKDNKVICTLSGLLMASIILSTVFLKQHSVFDVITAFVTAYVMYLFVYARSYSKNPAKEKAKNEVIA
uniref:phosphatase PAP2 family protein n=1 Tax=Agathobacter sp. TaxID=2021311 RepID=UPI004056418B